MNTSNATNSVSGARSTVQSAEHVTGGAESGVDGIPVVEYRTKFLAPSRWGDELVIESHVAALHRRAFDIEHRVVNAGVLAVQCAETRVCTALDAATGRARARELPARLAAALAGE